MTKAKTLDRVEMTRRKMAFREMMKHAHEVPAAPGVNENLEPVFNEQICPQCGGPLERWESCWRCKQCGTSLC